MGQSAKTAPSSQTEGRVPVTWDDEPFYLVSFGVAKSARYHAKLQDFYQGLSDFVLVANTLSGTAAFVTLFGSPSGTAVKVFVGIVAGCSAVSAALGFSRKAVLHNGLSRRFVDLSAKIATMEATDSNYRIAVAERLRIEKDEPPVKRLVDIAARNEELRSRGYSSQNMAPISRWQRVTGYLFSSGMTRPCGRNPSHADWGVSGAGFP